MEIKTSCEIEDLCSNRICKDCKYDNPTEHYSKRWVDVDDLVSQLEDWNNINGLNTFEVICKIKGIKN